MRVGSRLVALGAIAAAVSLACQGPAIPTSVQKGATFLLPLGGIFDADLGRVGYGSSVYTDRQRGALVFRLDGPGGPALVTRAVTSLAGPLASPHGIAAPFGSRTDLVVAMLDVPDLPEITEGVHTLHVVRRLGGVDLPAPAWSGTIAILPASIPAGGTPVTGTPTPFELLDVAGFDATAFVANTVPDPQLVFAATTTARAAELEIAFPASQIDVRDVTEAVIHDDVLAPPDWPAPGSSQSHRALSWWRISSPGVLSVGMLHPDRALRGVSVVFRLKAAATGPIAASAAQIGNARAWDAAGNPIAASWSPAWIR